jgi:hypothetical protein
MARVAFLALVRPASPPMRDKAIRTLLAFISFGPGDIVRESYMPEGAGKALSGAPALHLTSIAALAAILVERRVEAFAALVAECPSPTPNLPTIACKAWSAIACLLARVFDVTCFARRPELAVAFPFFWIACLLALGKHSTLSVVLSMRGIVAAVEIVALLYARTHAKMFVARHTI